MSLTTLLRHSVLSAIAVVTALSGASAQSNDTLIFNRGALFYINGVANGDSALVYVDGTVVNWDSTMVNRGRFIVKGDLINNAQLGDNAPLFGNDGLFQVYGKWENNGSFFGGTGEVRFMADDTITGTSVTRFNKLTLDFTTRRVLSGVDAEVGPTGRLALNRGEFATDYNTLWVLNPNVLAITRNNICNDCGFVSSLGDGTLARATNQVSPDYLFPVGSSYVAPGTSEIRYRPVTITPETTAPDMFHVRFANVNPSVFGMSHEDKDETLCYVNPFWYHRIHQEPGGPNATANVGVTFLPSPGTDFDFNAIAYWNDGNGQWENLENNTVGQFGQFNQFDMVSRAAWNGFLTYPENNYALAFEYPQEPVVDGDDALCASIEQVYSVPQNGSNYEFTIVPSDAGTIISQDQYSVTVIWNDVGNGTLQVIETVPNTINGGCASPARMVDVTIFPLPTADFSITPDSTLSDYAGGFFIDDMVEMADNSQLTNVWEWDFGDGVTSSQSNPFHTYDAIGEYDVTLIVTSELDCKDTLIQKILIEEGLIVPNVFTPNGDGFNDVFDVRTSNVGPFQIEIYNRWGNVVFEAVAPQISWDGTTRSGTQAPAGTYYFVISKAELNTGTAIPTEEETNFKFRETGWLQLIR